MPGGGSENAGKGGLRHSGVWRSSENGCVDGGLCHSCEQHASDGREPGSWKLLDSDGGESTEEFCRRLFGVPEGLALEAVLSVGITEKHPNPHLLQEAERGKVHYGTF